MKASTLSDKLAQYSVRALRTVFDLMTRFNKDSMSERLWLNRCIYLETIAGVPGMVGGMSRHMKSLRTLRHDHGLIHHLLNEAENERTHLFILMTMKQPGSFFKLMIALGQGVFFNFYFLAYLISPYFCHRFVGYLEEEAVHTYTILLDQLDKGKLSEWTNLPGSKIGIEYYELEDSAPMRDIILSIRADESIHRDLNHRFAEIIPKIDSDKCLPEEHINCEEEIEKILEGDSRVKIISGSKVT